MDKDTVIKVVKKYHNQYEVIFQSGRKILVLEDILLKFNLFKGAIISEKEFKTISLEQKINKQYQKALYYLNIKMRSKKEVYDYLKNDELPDEYIDPIIKKLEDMRFIDDHNYAKQYINSHIRQKDQGPNKIKNNLLRKGIDEHLIIKELENIDNFIWYQNATVLAQKSQKKYQNKIEKEVKQKINNKLLSAGYDYDIVNLVISELIFEYDEDQEWEQLCKVGDKLLKKYRKDSDYKKRYKIRQNLYRKGYSYDLIQRYIDDNLD